MHPIARLQYSRCGKYCRQIACLDRPSPLPAGVVAGMAHSVNYDVMESEADGTVARTCVESMLAVRVRLGCDNSVTSEQENKCT